MGFVAPWLGRHLSWGLFVVSIILILVSLGSLIRTALRNPGFLPRHHLEEDEEYGYGWVALFLLLFRCLCSRGLLWSAHGPSRGP